MPVEEPEDEHEAGLPPHPLDRVWFHPSELGPAMAAWQDAPATKHRDWGLAALVGLLSVAATVGILAAVGLFGGGSHSTSRESVASVLPGSATLHSAANVVTAASPSVVSVRVSGVSGAVQGSGVAIDGSLVLTSAALVSAGTTFMVAAADGKVETAHVVGTDPQTDLTLLAVTDSDLPAARLGHSDSLRVGDGVVALGLSVEDHHWAGGGIVSALHRIDPTPSGGMLTSVIETDMKLEKAPYAAGGALLDSGGSVVGILSASLPGQAIPIDLAQTVVEQMIASSGRVHHAWLGVGTVDATDRGGGGARVTVVVPDSPAAKTGLAVGDVITGVSGGRVADTGDLVAAIQELRPGDPIMLTAWRGNQRGVHQLALEDGTGPAGTAYGVMG